jgi:predicted dehydrogenase
MNVGLIGLGKMGLLHAGILNSLENVTLCAISEKESMLLDHIGKALPHVTVYQNYKEMLEKEQLDLVHITTPVSSHLPMTLYCIEKGVNFFVEKPLTRNLEEAKQVCLKLQNSNIFHNVGYNVRFSATFSKVKSLLNEEVLGKISDVKCSMYASNVFSKPKGWRFKKKISGGGVLLEMGCHLIDLLIWYFGKIEFVKGKTEFIYSEVEDSAFALLEFENKITGELDTSWSMEGYRIPEITFLIRGSNGMIKVNQDYIELKLDTPVGSVISPIQKIYKQTLEHGVPFDVGGPDYTLEDVHTINSILNHEKPLVDAFEASKTQSVIQAIYDSTNNDKKLKVDYIV